MIKFDHNNGDLRCAVFGGTINDMVADLCLEMSLIYGAMKNQSEDAARKFRRNIMMVFCDEELSKTIFSDGIYKAIAGDEHYTSGQIEVKDSAEFEKQLRQILEEEKNRNEGE